MNVHFAVEGSITLILKNAEGEVIGNFAASDVQYTLSVDKIVSSLLDIVNTSKEVL
jgi:hypothetical protein